MYDSGTSKASATSNGSIDSGTGGAMMIEFIYQGNDLPQTVSLGSVEIDDDGYVVKILDVNSTNVPGGKLELEQIMTAARWKVRLRPDT